MSTNSLCARNTQSCGCFGKEQALKSRKKHGMSGNKVPEYAVWLAMKQRCCNKNEPSYHNYGARGIIVCDRWKESFSAFISDMGRRPSDDHTIERVDVNGNYCPDNCIWIERRKQFSNMRKNVLITWNGETLCVSDWARRAGISRQCLVNRINLGVPLPDLFAPPRSFKKGTLKNRKNAMEKNDAIA